VRKYGEKTFEWYLAHEEVMYRSHAFPGLRCVPEVGRPKQQVENYERACTQVLFLQKTELGFFHFSEIVTGWLVPSTGQKIPVQPGWCLPPQKISLTVNSFLQEGNGAENTEEIQAVL
jgi:hypothetical protein